VGATVSDLVMPLVGLALGLSLIEARPRHPYPLDPMPPSPLAQPFLSLPPSEAPGRRAPKRRTPLSGRA
jgi:hypothetical protein